ncbi:ferredoxin-type protein NapG [Pseudomonadota bacterium]
MTEQTQQHHLGGLSRRRFLQNVARAACSASLLGVGVGLYGQQAQARPAWAIRPPGALNEDEFLGACLRCGLCVRDCPYDALRLADLLDPIPLGTPYFKARETPCEMCEDIPCVAACPSGSLDKGLTNIDDANMGIAVVVDQENCIAYQGLRCEVCYNICPLQGKSIRIERQSNRRGTGHARFVPVVYEEHCTGCGKCEYACVIDKPAIKVLPPSLARGDLGKHYRLGWQEKQKAGGSLIGDEPEHEYHMPEGLHYDFDQGLEGDSQEKGTGKESSPSSNPLDSLNRLMKETRK